MLPLVSVSTTVDLPDTVALDDFTTVTDAAAVVELLPVELAEFVEFAEPQAAIRSVITDKAARDGSERVDMI